VLHWAPLLAQPVAVFWVWGPGLPPPVVLVPLAQERQAPELVQQRQALLALAQQEPGQELLQVTGWVNHWFQEQWAHQERLEEQRRNLAGCLAPWRAMDLRPGST
jgi:hypothetical protein